MERGPDSKVWQRAVLQTNLSGEVTTNQQSYTELATGLCYLQDGQYVDSVEEVDSTANGAQAIQGRHQVQWSLNANNPGGAVILTTPDGKTLTSTVFGMAYYDVASGSNAAIAQLQDCNGSIVAPNQVLYASAFSNLTADVQYTYRKAGLSQDIVLRQAPPAPDRYGLSDETTILQVYTEFFNPPQPEAVAMTNGNVVDHQVLDFGAMKMGMGQALLLKGQDKPVSAGIVAKQWIRVDGRTFLIESIPYQAISNQLQELPQASNLKLHRGSVRRMVLMESNPSRPGGSAKVGRPMKLARVETTQPRLMVDYELLGSSSNLTLQGDTTYLVTSPVDSTAGPVIIEGGTVVKYTNSLSATIDAPNFICQTGPYRPGVFTSMNDNSVGSEISGSTGAPGTGSSCFLTYGALGTNSLVLRNLRFSYAGIGFNGAITSIGSNSIEISDCQFINCSNVFCAAVVANSGTHPGFPVYVYNVLFSQCTNGLVGEDYVSYLNISAINVTADQVGAFVSGGTSNVCYATNSIFTATGTSGVDLASFCTNASSNGVYQTVGAGSYYLADGSTNQNAGTTNIPSAVLEDLQTKTTYPPVTNSSYYLTNDYTFFPQAQRDNNGSTVDLGYHYDPLDYAISITISNATATVFPGTALAMNGPQYGVLLSSNAVFNCNGTATSPNYIVRYNTVQEQSNTNWESTNWMGSVLVSYQAGGLAVSFFFTDWSVLGGDGQFATDGNTVSPAGFQDCQFFGGAVVGNAQTLLATNCLFQRVNISLTNAGPSSTTSNTFCNNLFWEGELLYNHNTNLYNTAWTFRDNLFDHTAITVSNSSPGDVFSNNAYITNCSRLISSGGDVILASSPAYEIGILGDYYYPTNQTNLIHAGSRSAAAAGLYHYTVTTNNAIEGTNTVSIGFHYVACTNGLPIDTNGDGIPDYLEDVNGNGQVDSGEIAWNVAGDLGLTVVITQPANNSKIP